MAQADTERRLIVNADDFGASTEINHAVIEAHHKGILTSASLMVGGDAWEEAVALAREEPDLGVGLHITLVCGKSCLPASSIPSLVDSSSEFDANAVAAGLRYFFNRSLHREIEREIAAQFARFHGTGLKLDHVNGHLNFHLHPVVLRILLRHARDFGITAIRLTRDPFWLNTKLAKGRWLYRCSHGAIFTLLTSRIRTEVARAGIRSTRFVFGLLQNACVDEAFVSALIPRLPAGDSELYSHPSLIKFKPELDALVSSRVKALVHEQRVKLIRYQDL